MAQNENRWRNEPRDWRDDERRFGEGARRHEERETGDRLRGQDPGYSRGGYGAYAGGYGRNDYGRDDRGRDDGRSSTDWQVGREGRPSFGARGGQGRDDWDRDAWRHGSADSDYGQDFGDYGGRSGFSGYGGAGPQREERTGRVYSARDYGSRDYGRDDRGPREYDTRSYGPRTYGGDRSYEDYGFRASRSDERGFGHTDGFGESDYGRSDYSRSDSGRSDYGRQDYGRTGAGFGQEARSRRDQERGYGRDQGRDHDRGGERGWFERAGDEVASWFGYEDAERRRREDERRAAQHRGRGPRGYTRSDERIREDVSDRLSDDAYIDASEIDVAVSNGEVTLSGTIEHRTAKRRIEDIAESVAGVRHVQNNLRVRQQSGQQAGTSAGASALAGMSGGTGFGGTGGTGSSTSATSGTTGVGTGSKVTGQS